MLRCFAWAGLRRARLRRQTMASAGAVTGPCPACSGLSGRRNTSTAPSTVARRCQGLRAWHWAS
eukprot:2727507-Rhodomonas_salina.1